MKKERLAMIISLLLIVMTYACLLTGCGAEEENRTFFKVISNEYCGKVMYDTRTGVEYWCSSPASYNRGTLSVLVDKDGKPLIYEGSEKE